MVESALTIKSLTDLKFNKKKEIENELENQVNLLDDDAASEIHEKAAPLPKEERIEFVRKAVVEARANKLPVERVNRIVDEANSLKLKGEDRVAFIAEKVVTPAGFTAVASKLVESVVVQQRRGGLASKSNFFRRTYYVSISHEVLNNSIVVSLADIPPGPIAVKLQRKDKTINEQTFTNIGDFTLIDEDSNASVVFEDTTVKEGRIYEYRATLLFVDGAVEVTANNLVVEFCPAYEMPSDFFEFPRQPAGCPLLLKEVL